MPTKSQMGTARVNQSLAPERLRAAPSCRDTMALEPGAKRRWREGRIGNVALASPRGIAALVVLALSFVAVLATPATQLVNLVTAKADPSNREFGLNDLVVNLAFNALVLLILPIVALSIARPGDSEGVVRRLGLQVRPATIVHAAIGAGVTLVALVALGLALTGLSDAGIYEAEESELVPQLQALLTWPVVISISVLAGVTEEVFFRGLLQPRIGLVASSVFFGLIHVGYGTALQVVAPFLLGLLFGYLFQRTKSLWTAIVAHVTFDFVELAALLLQKQGILPA